MKKRLMTLLAAFVVTATGVFAQDYIVVGSSAEVFGSIWNGTSTDNTMTAQEDGTYTRTYFNVQPQSEPIQLKVYGDGNWIGGQDGNNVLVEVNVVTDMTVIYDPALGYVKVVLGPYLNDGIYYIYDETSGLFLSRGHQSGSTRAGADNYGIPFLVTGGQELRFRCADIEEGSATGYMGFDYDNVVYDVNRDESAANVFTLQFCSNDYEDKAFYIHWSKQTSGMYLKANRIILGGEVDDSWTGHTWRFLTVEEHDKIIAERETGAFVEALSRAGMSNPETPLQESGAPVVLSFRTEGFGWEQAYISGAMTTSSEGTSVYGAAYFNQSVNLPRGLYKVSITGFYRQGRNENVIMLYDKGFSMSNVFVDIWDNTLSRIQYTMPVKSWAADRTSDTEPSNFVSAANCFSDGKYVSEGYIYSTGGDFTIYVNALGELPGGWFMADNVTFTPMEASPTADYYLIGPLWGWSITENSPQLTPNPEVPGEYILENIEMYQGTELKVLSTDDHWYNDGGSNYIIEESATYTIHFRPAGNSEWTYYYIYAERVGGLSRIDEGQLIAIDVPLNGGTTKLLLRGQGSINGYLMPGDDTIGNERRAVSIGGRYPSGGIKKAAAKKTGSTRLKASANEGIYVADEDIPDYGYNVAVDPDIEGELTIPASFTYNGVEYDIVGIDENAFATCTGLTKINLPESLQYIESQAFWLCSSLQSIHIPAATQDIETLAMFIGCDALESITVDENNPYYFAPQGSNTLIGRYDNSPKAPHRHFNISTSKNIPSRVGNWVYYVAAGCKNSIIPEEEFITSIDNCAFAGFPSLKNITIPENISYIGDNAFMACTDLRQIIMKSDTPPTLGDDVFDASLEGRTLDFLFQWTRYFIKNGDYPEMEDISPVEPPVMKATLVRQILTQAKRQMAEADEDAEQHDPQVYQHAALCVPAGAKETYSAPVYYEKWDDEKTDPQDNPWSNFTHIIEPTVVPESGTIIFSYDENFYLPQGATAYIVTQSTDGGSTAFVTVEQVNDAIPGGTAVIVKATPATEFYVIPAQTYDIVADVTGNMLVAVDQAPTNVESNEGDNSNFVLQEDGTFVPASGNSVDSGTGYLQLPTQDTPDTDAPIVIDFDGQLTTAISTLQPSNLSFVTRHSSLATFTLDGRRLNAQPTQRGIYIIRGKKTVVTH